MLTRTHQPTDPYAGGYVRPAIQCFAPEVNVSHSAYLMIVAEGRSGVALVRQAGRHTVPHLDAWDGDTDTLTAALSRPLGHANDAAPHLPWRPPLPPLTVLANLAQVATSDEEEGDGAQLFLCEPWLAADLADLTWWNAGDADPAGVPAALVAVMRTSLALLTGSDVPAEAGVAWPRYCLPGATRIIADALAADPVASALASLPTASGPPTPTDVRQLRGWSLSSVWTNDEVVLKVTHPSWPAEPKINRLLSAAAPHLVEEVVASGWLNPGLETATPWLLQRRARSTEVVVDSADAEAGDRRRHALRLRCVRALASLQLSLEHSTGALLEAGVVDRTIGAVTEALPALWRSSELASSLEPDELTLLPRLDEWLRGRLAALAALGTPPLLAHGDLHLGNVIEVDGGQVRLIDWTDAALSWAGVDLLTLRPSATHAAEREELITTYEEALGPRYAPAVRPGLELALLFHALGYAKIDAFLPPSARWQLGGTVTRLVRRLLVEATV